MKFERNDTTSEAVVFARYGSVSFDKYMMKIVVRCPIGKYDWKYLMIGYSYKIDSDREDYLIQPDKIVRKGIYEEMTCTIDVREFPFKTTHWRVRAVYEKDGQLYTAGIVMPVIRQSRFEFAFKPNHFVREDGYILFPYRARGGYLGLRFREKSDDDSLWVRLKEWIAISRYTKKKTYYDGKKIFLIYEKRCEKAQDNGYHFFRYCMENDMESYLGRSIYYVIKKDSVDRKKLEKYNDHVLDYLSVKHMIYLLACRLLISSDSKAHAYIWQFDKSLLWSTINRKDHIFLGHGVLALKKLNQSFMAKNMNSVMTTVTSEMEKELVIRELGYKRHAAVVTGYARFDALVDCSDEYNEILIMPTHRSWLFGVQRDVFTASEYYKRYMDLINDPRLIKLLEEKDMVANFYLHPSIGEHVDAFTIKSDRVKIIPYGKYALDDLMMRAKLLVTDYSSICWDVYYMGKPILFYQYDLQDYLDTWGSYIDLTKDSPGKRATEHEQLMDLIEESAANGFQLDEEWKAKRESHYSFLDQHNSLRICDALKERNY